MPSRARAEDAGLLLFVPGQPVDEEEEFTEDGSHGISVCANNLIQSSKPPTLGLTKAMQEALVERPPHSLQGCTSATAPFVPAISSIVSFDERASPRGGERCAHNLAPREEEEEDGARELEAPRHARIEPRLNNAERGRKLPRSHRRLSRDTGEKHASMAAAATGPLWRDSWSDDGGSLDARGSPQPVWRDSGRACGAAFCEHIFFSTRPRKSPNENSPQFRTVVSSSIGNRTAFVSPRSPGETMLELEAADDDSGSSVGGGGASMPRERRACGTHLTPPHHTSSRVANNPPPRRRKGKTGECRERCERSAEAGAGETMWKDAAGDIRATNVRSRQPDRKESVVLRQSRGIGSLGVPRSDRKGYGGTGSCQQGVGGREPQAFVFLCPSSESPGAKPAISGKRHMPGRRIPYTGAKK